MESVPRQHRYASFSFINPLMVYNFYYDEASEFCFVHSPVIMV